MNRFLLATSTMQLAAPIIIRIGEPVMAMGGFMGRDPILTPERLARLVEAQAVRFVMVGDFAGARRLADRLTRPPRAGDSALVAPAGPGTPARGAERRLR